MLKFMYNLTQILSNVSKEDNFLFKMKYLINETNSSDDDYIVSDAPIVLVLDFIQRLWNTDNVMVVYTPIPFQPQYNIIPWTFQRIISPFTDNSSLFDWFLNTVIFNPIKRAALLLAVFIKSNFFGLKCIFTNVTWYYINTVVDVNWLNTLLPLQHCVGPMLLQSSLPLNSSLVEWLSNQSIYFKIIYISMGTTGEVNDVMAKAFTELWKDYSIVWSLCEFNHNILKDLTINKNLAYN